MPGREGPAGFQNTQKADDVAVNIRLRLIDGKADARLRGQVNDVFRLLLLEYCVQKIFIRDIAANESPALRRILCRRRDP